MSRLFLLILLLFSISYSSDYKVFYIKYTVKVKGISGDLKLWIPLPQRNALQEVIYEKIETVYPYKITEDRVFKNRTVFINVHNPENFSVVIKAKIKRYEASKKRRDNRTFFIREALKQRTFIPISEDIKKLAYSVIKNARTPEEKARNIYYHTLEKLDYDKSVPGWGRGDFYYASEVCKGNCTDFHTYFITLMRNIGIPAIFEIGFPISKEKQKGKIEGYHCWASFWNGTEWIPVDISEADKKPHLRDYFFGNLDPYRISFTIGRDLTLEPEQSGKPLNYFIYPYAELNGKKYSGVIWQLTYEILF